jgi:hypothetical protein
MSKLKKLRGSKLSKLSCGTKSCSNSEWRLQNEFDRNYSRENRGHWRAMANPLAKLGNGGFVASASGVNLRNLISLLQVGP